MPRAQDIPECPAMPGVFYQVRGEDQIRRASVMSDRESIVSDMLRADPEGYWGPQIELPYPMLPHPVVDYVDDDGDDEHPRFPLADDASENDRLDEAEYNRQRADMERLMSLRDEAGAAVRRYLDAWREARRMTHDRAVSVIS